MLTVRDLLSNSSLRLTPLVVGDLEREISWIHASEMPDPSPFLRGGEVVLTAGLWYSTGSGPDVFVEGLVRIGAAAIGFGPSPIAPEVPTELVAACEHHQLTLFLIPSDVPFIAAIEVFVEHHVQDREGALLDAAERNRQFIEFAHQGRGIEGVLSVLKRHRTGAAWVMDDRRGLLAWTGKQPPDDLVTTLHEWQAGADDQLVAPGWLALPITVTATDAWLVVEDHGTSLSVVERAVIEQAIAFIAIELQRDRAVRESERRFAAELFDLILAGDGQLSAVTSRLEAFGLDPYGPLVAIVVDVEDVDGELASLEQALNEGTVPAIAAVKGLQLVTLARSAPEIDWPAAFGRELQAKLSVGCAVGIGGVAANVKELRRSLTEAQQACRLAKRRPTRFAVHSDGGSHALLLALQDDHVLSTFQNALLGPLIAHDAKRNTHLVRTLALFLESGGAYQSIADTLFLHVNTLRGRLARIEKLTGRSLSDMETRVDFFLALRSQSLTPGPAGHPGDTKPFKPQADR